MILTYNNFIDNLYDTFPDFKESLKSETVKMIEDNPIVTFGFFIDHFHKKLGDEKFEKELINLLDRMMDIESLDAVLDDFCLNIYSLMHEKGIDINPFLSKLTPRTKKTYDLNVNMWERGNGIKR
jgi:hypothetical protein